MIIIPARMDSSRFANKVLVDVLGLPMVIRTALQVKDLDDVAIATDSYQVIDVAQKYGIKAIMTSNEHKSGTDRVNECANILGLKDDDIIVNVQADEPFIEKEVISKVIDRIKQGILDKEDFTMVSCHKKISSELADDPNHVKVVLDTNSNAIYFSRSKVPYHRDHYADATYNGHLGIYGFSKKSLNMFCQLQPAPLENIEKLEQLRAISAGYRISMVEVVSKSFGIDTKEDLENAIKIFG